MNKNTSAVFMALLLSSPAVTLAVPFEYIRIGDIDGFGFGDAAGFLGADGLAANRDSAGILGTGDLLPDLNEDGFTRTREGIGDTTPPYGDDFDNRSAGESISCVAGSCTVNAGSTGQLFTDISLSTSYDDSSAKNTVWNDNTKTYGTGGAFPSDPSMTRPNQPGFMFDFSVSATDIDSTANVYFNLVFGDYDVTPAEVSFIRGDGSTFTEAVTVQPGNLDGLIQAAFVELSFKDVFTWNATTNLYDGFLDVDFDAVNEPYTAFDFVELSMTAIVIQPPGGNEQDEPRAVVPLPSTVFLLLIGLAGLRYRKPRTG